MIKRVSNRLHIRIGCPVEEEIHDKNGSITIWIVPKFLAMQSTCPFKAVEWKSDIGIFWTKSTIFGSARLDQFEFDYLTEKSFAEITQKSLFQLWKTSRHEPRGSTCNNQAGFSLSCYFPNEPFSIQFP
jgi:hypothetical protein